MRAEFPLWCRSRLPPIQVLNDPREVEAARVHLRLDELRRRRGDEEPTPKIEVKHECLDPNRA